MIVYLDCFTACLSPMLVHILDPRAERKRPEGTPIHPGDTFRNDLGRFDRSSQQNPMVSASCSVTASSADELWSITVPTARMVVSLSDSAQSLSSRFRNVWSLEGCEP